MEPFLVPSLPLLGLKGYRLTSPHSIASEAGRPGSVGAFLSEGSEWRLASGKAGKFMIGAAGRLVKDGRISNLQTSVWLRIQRLDDPVRLREDDDVRLISDRRPKRLSAALHVALPLLHSLTHPLGPFLIENW